MRVFFLAPFEGKQKYQEAFDLIVAAIEATGCEVISPEKTEAYRDALSAENVERFGDSNNTHYQFIRKGILECDAVIVETSVESFRVGHETTLAILYKKPVLCLSQFVDMSEYIRYDGFSAEMYTLQDVNGIVEAFLQRVGDARGATHHPNRQEHANRIGLTSGRRSSKIAVLGFIGIDLFTKVEKFPAENHPLLSEGLKMALGGKAANAAVALTRLGEEVTIIGKVGSDPFGDRAKLVLDLEGIDTHHVATDTFSPTGTVLVNVDLRGKNTVIVNEDANQRVLKSSIDHVLERIDGGELDLDAFYVTYEVQPELINYAIREMHARNTFIFCDPAPFYRHDQISTNSFSLIDVLAPNQYEASAMTGIDVVDEQTATAAAKRLRENGAHTVIVSLGDLGAVMLLDGSDDAVSLGAHPVRIVDETGAGDAFRAAYLSEFLITRDAKTAIRLAARAGAFAVTHFGGVDCMPTQEQLVGLDLK